MFKNLLTKVKHIELKKLIYPGILGSFILLTLLLFIYSARFLSRNLDRAFTLDTEAAKSELITVDLEKFTRVARKLGIEVKIPESFEENIPAITAMSTPSNLTPPKEPEPTKEIPGESTKENAPPLDKTLIKIVVLNGSGIKGAAADLKTFLEENGFVVERIGNADETQEKTTISLKESKKEYTSLLKEVVTKKYELGADEVLEENKDYDALVVIGGK